MLVPMPILDKLTHFSAAETTICNIRKCREGLQIEGVFEEAQNRKCGGLPGYQGQLKTRFSFSTLLWEKSLPAFV